MSGVDLSEVGTAELEAELRRRNAVMVAEYRARLQPFQEEAARVKRQAAANADYERNWS